MNTPAAEPRYKTAKGPWYTPPPNTPLYSALPRATRSYQALATKTEWALLQVLIQLPNSTHTDDWTWTCKPPGKADLAKMLDCGISTVKRGLKALERKHFIRQSLVFYRGERKCKGKRIIVYPFADALNRRKKDDQIAKTNDKRVIFRGRGRRPMTPAQAAAWKVQLDRVPEFIEDEGDVFEGFDGAQPTQDAPAASPEVSPGVVEMPAAQADETPDPIYEALCDVCTAGAPAPRDAGEVYRSLNDDKIPREYVAGWLREEFEGRRKVNPSQRLSVKWYIGKMPGYLARYRLWVHRQAVDKAKAERFETDQRINNLAWQVQQHDETTDPVEREYFADAFTRANPAEMAKARELVADKRARSA